MSIKLKKSLIFIFLGISLCLVSCQKESLKESNRVSKFTVERLTLNNFEEKEKVEQYIQSLTLRKKKNRDFENRYVYDSINDFTVYTDEFVLIENDNREWLVFSIFRDFETNLTENLVLQKNGDADFFPFLYQYNLSTDELDDLNNGLIINDLYYKTTILSLQNYNTNILAREHDGGFVPQIYSLPDGRCGRIDHISYELDGLIYVSFVIVPCTGGAGGYTNTTGSDTGPNNYYSYIEWGNIFNNYINDNNYYGNGSNGAGNNNAGNNNSNGGFINLPNDPNTYFLDITFVITPPQVDQNIIALNTLTSSTRKPYKQKIAELKLGLNDSLESGFEFRTNPNNNTIETIAVPSTAVDGLQFGLPEINTTVRMHNHPEGLDPIFSKEDILGMSELFAVKDDLGAEDAGDVISLLVTPRGLQALKVDDPDKVVVFLDKMKTGMDEDYETIKKKFYRDYERFVIITPISLCGGCTQEQLRVLIEEYLMILLDEWDTGLSLYIGTENADGTYTWKK